jgi:hypothetical protein
MKTKLIAVRSIDLVLAATSVRAKNFDRSIKNSAEIVEACERMYEAFLSDINDKVIKEDILETTSGSWKNTAFPLELLKLTNAYATVVLGGMSYRGLIFDICALDWQRLAARSTCFEKQIA